MIEDPTRSKESSKDRSEAIEKSPELINDQHHLSEVENKKTIHNIVDNSSHL